VSRSIVEGIHNTIVMPVLKDMNGMIDVRVFDCAHPTIKEMGDKIQSNNLAACDWSRNEQHAPSMMLFRNPEVKKNPYTGEPMQLEAKQFPNAQISLGILKNWIKDFMPDYSIKINS
jgi:hypothetical protein